MSAPIAPIDPEMLLQAYTIGVFPMADSRDAPSVYWVEPKRRAVLPLNGFHLSKSLRKTLLSGELESTANHAFGDVVELCAAAVENRPATWINSQIETAVTTLHGRGHAHSIETWADGELVGGLYGLALGRAFFGESMVSRVTNASKVALAHLVARLRAGGFTLLDCQFMTPHLASLGAIEISRDAYRTLLDESLSLASPPGDFALFDAAVGSTVTVSGPKSGWRIVQSLVQTS